MIRGRCLICGDIAYSPTLEDANRAWNQHYLHHHYQPPNGRRWPPPEETPMTPPDDLTTRFAYHPPSHTGIARMHEDTRHACGALAQVFDILLPAGREKALAITKLEEAMFWANAAIARNQGGAE